MSNFPRSAHTFDYPRYLKALEPVSARSQSEVLYQQFLEALVSRSREMEAVPRVLEIGAGRGDQMKRILHDMALRDVALHYTALEPESANRAIVETEVRTCNTDLHTIEIKSDPFLSFMTGEPVRSCDAIVARSVLDLMPLQECLAALNAGMSKAGVLYAPLTFAMATRLAPYPGERTNKTESQIVSVYHQSVLKKLKQDKNVYLAQEVMNWANEKNARVDVRGSDWVIAPSKKKYRGDESYALQSILAFMHDETEKKSAVEQTDLDVWWATRMRMLHGGTLIYTANQFDLLICFP